MLVLEPGRVQALVLGPVLALGPELPVVLLQAGSLRVRLLPVLLLPLQLRALLPRITTLRELPELPVPSKVFRGIPVYPP